MNLISCDRSRKGPMLEILNDVILNSTAIYDYRPRTLEMMDAWFETKERGSFPIIGLAGDDGRLIGFGSYGMFRNWPAYKYTVEHSIYLEKSYRGKGLGKILLGAIIDAAKQQHYHNLIGGIDSGNAASISLHQQFGFELCATIRQAGYKFDRWLDLTFYQLILPTPEHPVDG
jgi:L-amino acid N-acyltransferase YncA